MRGPGGIENKSSSNLRNHVIDPKSSVKRSFQTYLELDIDQSEKSRLCSLMARTLGYNIKDEQEKDFLMSLRVKGVDENSRVYINGNRGKFLFTAHPKMKYYSPQINPMEIKEVTERTEVPVSWQKDPLIAEPGDLLLINDKGKPHPIKKDIFDKTYTLLEDGRATKSAKTKAVKMDRDFVVDTLEGRAEGKKGDYLAQGVDGECWPIPKETFEKRYQENGEDLQAGEWVDSKEQLLSLGQRIDDFEKENNAKALHQRVDVEDASLGMGNAIDLYHFVNNKQRKIKEEHLMPKEHDVILASSVLDSISSSNDYQQIQSALRKKKEIYSLNKVNI